jgi:hypothetical protein
MNLEIISSLLTGQPMFRFADDSRRIFATQLRSNQTYRFHVSAAFDPAPFFQQRFWENCRSSRRADVPPGQRQ